MEQIIFVIDLMIFQIVYHYMNYLMNNTHIIKKNSYKSYDELFFKIFKDNTNINTIIFKIFNDHFDYKVEIDKICKLNILYNIKVIILERDLIDSFIVYIYPHNNIYLGA